MYNFSCTKAYNLLQTEQDIKQRWINAVRWLRDQLERQNHIPSNYSYYQSQGQTAKKACDLCSDKENDDIGSNSDEGDEN
ncbi:unnamed protein product [Rotaria sordida]|uniref:Uncharacterized protein n=1 Tax=Rotaria sordida TaxID=392033 RepID=A0A819WRK0_9BILA|nr:unnamed protein product [Rotaria sordida]CAF1524982.1 unnamed protein product [Rotaria sordida]CAF1538670.1 unnamed protein product [Rotaria sordida]CAF3938900.1 unnamed protein product [Rotaria sordida]CAF4129372.1 unnamed protein product [Rotaria sordida]